MSMVIDGTNGLTFPDSSHQQTGIGYNRIINGACMIDQRNAGASVSFSGSSAYTLDRWKAQSPAGTIQQITSTISNFANSLKYTSTGSNAYVQIGQQIEYNNCYDLQNQTVSISFSIKANNSNSGSTALTVRTRTGATINGSIIFSGTNVDTSVTISTTATTYTVTRALPSTFGALSLEFVLGSHVSGDGFEVTGVQLEKGSTATSFDYRPYGTELQLCQRYFQVLKSSWAVGTSTTAISGILPFYQELRAAPTLGKINNNIKFGDRVAVGNGSSSTPTISSDDSVSREKQIGFNLGGFSGFTTRNMYIQEVDSTNTGLFTVSAEL